MILKNQEMSQIGLNAGVRSLSRRHLGGQIALTLACVKMSFQKIQAVLYYVSRSARCFAHMFDNGKQAKKISCHN